MTPGHLSSKITVTRYHDICTGHRVLNHEGKCKYLHGHGYRIHFTCTADSLDQVGRIIDFGAIKQLLCGWLDRNWDHKTILFEDDPLLDAIPAEHVYVVAFNPTAENMALFLLNKVGPVILTNTGVRLVKVRIDETPKCSAEVSL